MVALVALGVVDIKYPLKFFPNVIFMQMNLGVKDFTTGGTDKTWHIFNILFYNLIFLKFFIDVKQNPFLNSQNRIFWCGKGCKAIRFAIMVPLYC